MHSVMLTHMNRPNSSLDCILPHWAHFTVLRFIFVCIMCIIRPHRSTTYVDASSVNRPVLLHKFLIGPQLSRDLGLGFGLGLGLGL